MRKLRWKTKYRTGLSTLDDRKKALADSMNEFVAQANQVEHCQDLSDFFDQIATATESMLAKSSTSAPAAGGEIELLENQLRELLESNLPFGARGTPACTDCCMCSLLEKRTKAWLGDAFENRAQCEQG